jgi:hypothetical protein
MDDSWPTADFTLEENRRDMARKERRRARRQSFTYTVVSPDESRVLGCVYINEGIGGPDAAVFLWVRQSEADGPLDQELEAAVRNWMKEAWASKMSLLNPTSDIERSREAGNRGRPVASSRRQFTTTSEWLSVFDGGSWPASKIR